MRQICALKLYGVVWLVESVLRLKNALTPQKSANFQIS